MKKYTFPFSLLLFGAIITTLTAWSAWTSFKAIQTGKTERREAFESFLLSTYKKAPQREKDLHGKAMDAPDMAAFQDYLVTMDPATRKVPRERLLAAYQYTRNRMSMKSSLNDLDWQGYGADMGGRTRALMYDPNDPNHRKVWAGGVTGGLWYNNNITSQYSSWVPVGDLWPVLTIRCITYDPNNTQVFYIGTGEPETAMTTYRESSGTGQGIWRSADGGQTWTMLPSTTGFEYVTDILVRNEGGMSVIYACVVSGVYHGTHQSQPSDGLFRSDDGGESWTQVLPDIYGSDVPYAPSDIDQGPEGRIYVGSRPNLQGEGGATLLYSDTGLPGSWVVNDEYKTEIENNPDRPIPGRVVLSACPSDPNVVYALVSSGYINSVNSFQYFNCYHILRSSDKGSTWVKKSLPSDLTSGTNFATIAWHALDIGVDPNDANHLYIGGLDMHKSSNGGNTWTRVSDWSLMYYGGGPMYIHADQHIVLFKPGSSTEAIFGSDGGVFYTADANSPIPSFEEHNMGYNTLQFYTCAIHPDAGTDVFLGGLQDNGSLYYTGTPLTIFDMVSGGDGACCFFDENEPNLSISSIYYNQYYIYNYGNYINGLYNWSSGTFVSPADYDFRRNAIYANAVDFIGTHADDILRLTNLTGSGTGAFLDLNTGSDVFFSAVTYSPYSTNAQANLFVGSQSGRLFRVEHAESTPVVTEITGNNFPAGSISCIAVGGSDDTLLVTFSNYGVTSVFQSYNGGQSWQDKEGSLPDMPVRWALYHPDDSRHALLATETGIWSTHNLDETVTSWEPANGTLPNVRVDMLRLRSSDNTVLAATHGRGFYTTVYDLPTSTKENRPKNVTVYPNPSDGIFTLTFESIIQGRVDVEVLNSAGQQVIRRMFTADGNSRQVLDLRAEPAGVYFLSVKRDGKQAYQSKLVVL